MLDRIRQISDDFSNGKISQGNARIALKTFLRAEGKDNGTRGLSNLASTARLNLILRQNAAMARSAGEYARMHDPDVMKAFPYVIYHSKKDAYSRGAHAALDGKIFSKNDPFLRTHTPPWEFNCRCWLEDCDYDTAQKHGVVPMTPPSQVRVDSASGFAFDPASAFKKFDLGSTIRDPERMAHTIENMAEKFPNEAKEVFHSESNGDKFLEGKSAEINRRMAQELPSKVLPKNPKEFLQGKDLERAEENARNAVSPAKMKKTDDAVAKIGEDALEPFYHYSSRPDKGENYSIRYASDPSGVVDWSKISLENAAKIRALDALCNTMPEYHGTLYRGCCFDDPAKMNDYIGKILQSPESLTGFVSMTPDPVLAAHYASAEKYKVVLIVPNSKNAVYFGPYSKHPEDEEALLSRNFYLRGLKTRKEGDTVYVLTEEVSR